MRVAVVGVDVAHVRKKSRAVGLVLVDGRLDIAEVVRTARTPYGFAVEVAGLALRLQATVAIEDQYVGFAGSAKKLITASAFVQAICEDRGVEYETIAASSWQSRVLRASDIEPTKRDRKTKERAEELCRRLWPRMDLTEDEMDAALIGLDALVRRAGCSL